MITVESTVLCFAVTMQPSDVTRPIDSASIAAILPNPRPPVKIVTRMTRSSRTITNRTAERSKSVEPDDCNNRLNVPNSYLPRTRSAEYLSQIPRSVDDDEDDGNKDEETGNTRGHRQKLVLVMLALNDLVSMMALSILAPFFPKEASAKGVSDVLSGWIFGVFALVQCFTSPLFGKMSFVVCQLPFLGARFTCFAGLFFAGGCTVLFGFLMYIPVYGGSNALFVAFCFILRMFMAVGVSANTTASFALAVTAFPDNPATVLGLLETAVGIGLMLGPALGGVLFEVGGFMMPFTVLGTIMMLTIPVCIWVVPAEREPATRPTSGSIRQLLAIPTVSITGLAIIASSCAWVFLDPTLEPHLRVYNLSATVIGLVFLLMSACYAICSPIWGWIADNVRDSAPMMVLGFLLTAVGFTLIGPSPLITSLTGDHGRALWLDIVALMVIGVAASLALVPSYDKILDASEQAGVEETLGNYSAVAGLWNGCYSLGEFLGPVLAGWLMGTIGFPWAMTGVAGACLIMAVIMFVLYLYEKKYGPTGVIKKERVQEQIVQTVDERTSDERTPLLSNGTVPVTYSSYTGDDSASEA